MYMLCQQRQSRTLNVFHFSRLYRIIRLFQISYRLLFLDLLRNTFPLSSPLDPECDVRPGVRAAGAQRGAGQAHRHTGGQAGLGDRQPAGAALPHLPSHNPAATGLPGRLRSPFSALLASLGALGTLRAILDFHRPAAAFSVHGTTHLLRQWITPTVPPSNQTSLEKSAHRLIPSHPKPSS